MRLLSHQPTSRELSIPAAISRNTRFWILPPFGPLTIGRRRPRRTRRAPCRRRGAWRQKSSMPLAEFGAAVGDERDGPIALADFAHADHLRAA